jgi:hypothetical protein
LRIDQQQQVRLFADPDFASGTYGGKDGSRTGNTSKRDFDCTRLIQKSDTV